MAHYGAPGTIVNSGANAANMAPLQIPTSIARNGEQTLYSAWYHPAGQVVAGNTYRHFSTQEGGNGQGFPTALSLGGETNMKEASRLPAGLSFLVLGVATHIYSWDQQALTYADITTFQNHSIWQWNLLQTRIDVCPIVLSGAGGGPFGATADTGLALGPAGAAGGSGVALNNGNGSVWVYQKHPIQLPAQTQFTFDNVVGTGAPNIYAYDGTSAEGAVVVKPIFFGVFLSAIPSA